MHFRLIVEEQMVGLTLSLAPPQCTSLLHTYLETSLVPVINMPVHDLTLVLVGLAIDVPLANYNGNIR